ncbi:transposase [Halomicrobium salinisoli]|uniref:transposase n=1 Tax=Halomicrobium salinisoli TaxID=2878391 RepID=UPI001CEFE73A|nr:transposase [Halomicrobium salinisoli]
MPSTPDQSDATHQLLVRGEGRDRVDAANAVAEAAFAAGDEASLSVRDVDDLAELSPHSARVLRQELEPVPAGERVNGGDFPEFRAVLPEDADALLRALTVAGDLPQGEASWRAWEVYVLAVYADDEWLYHAVPHHGQWYLRDAAAPSFPDRASEAVAPCPSAVVPTDPVVAWSDGRYRLDHRALHVGETSHALDRLKRAVVDVDRAAVEFEWRGPYEGLVADADGVGEAVFHVGLATVLLPLALLTDEPDRVDAETADTAARIESALTDIADAVGYDYAVVRAGR